MHQATTGADAASLLFDLPGYVVLDVRRDAHGGREVFIATEAVEAACRVAIPQAVDNRTVRDLNARARSDGILAGTIARDGVTLHDGLTAGVGDRIVTRHNNRRLRTKDRLTSRPRPRQDRSGPTPANAAFRVAARPVCPTGGRA